MRVSKDRRSLVLRSLLESAVAQTGHCATFTHAGPRAAKARYELIPAETRASKRENICPNRQKCQESWVRPRGRRHWQLRPGARVPRDPLPSRPRAWAWCHTTVPAAMIHPLRAVNSISARHIHRMSPNESKNMSASFRNIALPLCR